MLISVNLPNMSGGVHSFLSARISIQNVLLVMFLTTAWPVVFHLFGLYELRRIRQLRAEAGRLVGAITAGAGLALVFPLTSVSGALTVSHVGHFWLTTLALGLLVRTGRRAVDRARDRHARRILIVGTGRLAQRAHRDIHTNRRSRYEVVGFVDEPTSDSATAEVVEQTIGTLEQLEQILMREVIDEVVIALPVKSCYQQIQHAIGVCERAGVKAKYGTDLFESTVAFPRYDHQGDRAFVAMLVAPDGYRLVIKRAIDVIGAAAALVMCAPLILIVAIAIKVTSPGRIIYPQDRCGLNKRPFRMYKFRSMYVHAEKLQAALEAQNEASGPVFKIRDDPRITPLGRLLRKSSLDELPQLWNVLRGDMSLVGPRPLPWRDVQRISRPSDMRRFSADVVAMPYRQDYSTCHGVVHQTAGMGKLMLCSRISKFDEVTRGGSLGLIVGAYDRAAWVEAMDQALTDDAHGAPDAGRDRRFAGATARPAVGEHTWRCTSRSGGRRRP